MQSRFFNLCIEYNEKNVVAFPSENVWKRSTGIGFLKSPDSKTMFSKHT